MIGGFPVCFGTEWHDDVGNVLAQWPVSAGPDAEKTENAMPFGGCWQHEGESVRPLLCFSYFLDSSNPMGPS